MGAQFDLWRILIKCDNTDIQGLKWYPQMLNYDNDQDWAPFTLCASVEVPPQNFNLVENLAKIHNTNGIMEIGIARNGFNSFTWALLKNKPQNVKYLGVDIADKTFLDSKENNIHTIQTDSQNQELVRSKLKELGIDKISILLIDGWHSLNTIINDWRYSDLLDETGVVIMHDSNYHPGPLVLSSMIDDKMYIVERHFEREDDPGICVASKRNLV